MPSPRRTGREMRSTSWSEINVERRESMIETTRQH
jgi:hypothetical protein